MVKQTGQVESCSTDTFFDTRLPVSERGAWRTVKQTDPRFYAIEDRILTRYIVIRPDGSVSTRLFNADTSPSFTEWTATSRQRAADYLVYARQHGMPVARLVGRFTHEAFGTPVW